MFDQGHLKPFVWHNQLHDFEVVTAHHGMVLMNMHGESSPTWKHEENLLIGRGPLPSSQAPQLAFYNCEPVHSIVHSSMPDTMFD